MGKVFSGRLSRGALLLCTVDPRALPHRPALGERQAAACWSAQRYPAHIVLAWERIALLSLKKRAFAAHRLALGEKSWRKITPWESGREGPCDLPAETSGATSASNRQTLPSRDVAHRNQEFGSQNAVFLPTRDDVCDVGGGGGVLRGFIAMKWAVRGSARLCRACAAGPAAPCALRWQTAPPFAQLRAPSGVRTHGRATGTTQPRELRGLSANGWAVRGSNPRPWD